MPGGSCPSYGRDCGGRPSTALRIKASSSSSGTGRTGIGGMEKGASATLPASAATAERMPAASSRPA
eukprot:13217862-Alexandrium_andersonii.AAC.1